MYKTIIAAFFVCFVVCNLSAGKVFHQRLNYRIIVQEKSTKVQQFAAEELKKFLDLTYARPMEVNGSTQGIVFMVGFPSEAVMAGFTNLPQMEHRFGIFKRGSTFLLYGYDAPDVDPVETSLYETGTLSAVYYFLTRYAGVNFYFPGEKGYSVTHDKPVLFMDSQDIPKPTFEVRGIRANKSREFSSRDLNVFSRRMLCNRPFWSRFDYYYVYMYRWKKRFWKDHPEYFMMINDKRVAAKYPFHVPCLSNPDVVKQTAADLIAKINADPKIRVIRLFCDAPIELCQCPVCKKLWSKDDVPAIVRVSNAVYGFQKKVMDIVHQTHPDIYFISQTKGRSYGTPPEKIKMGPKFAVEILTRRPSPTSDYANSINQAKAWKKAGVRTILKSYPRHPAFKDYPIIAPDFTQNYLRRFVGLTRGAYLTEVQKKAYSLSALNQYIQAKVLFDIDAHNKRLVAKFCNFAYPGAENEMVAFYREMERLMMNTTEINEDHLMTNYYFDNLVIAKTLLDTAAKKIKDDYWFKKLYQDFNAFYAKSLAAKPQADIFRKAAAPPAPVTIPEIKTGVQDKWAGALKLELMPLNKYKDYQPASVHLTCDDDNLYLKLVAIENNIQKLRQNCRVNNQGPVWSDDCFEIMLVPDKSVRAYYQIGVNSLGTYNVLYHRKNKSVERLPGFKIQTSSAIDKGKWIVEMKIPLDEFDAVDFAKTWKFNVFRTRILDGIPQFRQSSGVRLFYTLSYHNLKHYALLRWPERKKSFWNCLKFW